MIHKPGAGTPPKRILVVSYSQSGQLAEVVSALLAPFSDAAFDIAHVVLRPVAPFPFPWPAYRFFDVFPESFQEIGCALEPLGVDQDEPFDLVIIAYQVWYLAPSLPVSSFLQSAEARRLLRNKTVVTVVGARNMWYRAHARVKDHLRRADAHLIGHIALTDAAPNLVSVITIVYWMLSGKKERLLGLFPKPGIADQDIARCAAFGRMIVEVLGKGCAADLQNRLDAAGACRIVPHLVMLENAASRAFRLWSTLILRAKSRRGRKFLVKTFGFYLACGIAILSPLSFLLFYLTLPFRRTAVQSQVEDVCRY